MSDWFTTLLAVVITAIIAPVVKSWLSRRKTEAETDSEVAETMVALTTAWDKLLVTSQARLEVAEAGIERRDEELRNRDEEIADLREQAAMLFEQKVAIMAHNTALTAALATARGVDVLNNVDYTEGDASE